MGFYGFMWLIFSLIGAVWLVAFLIWEHEQKEARRRYARAHRERD